jgi:hypothetical protein
MNYATLASRKKIGREIHIARGSNKGAIMFKILAVASQTNTYV